MPNNTDNKLSDDNIFSELSKEIDNNDQDNKKIKDLSYYIKLSSYIIGYINLLLLFIIATIFGYNYLQNSNYSFENSFIKSNCNILLGDSYKLLDGECMTITSANNIYQEKQKELEEKTFSQLMSILPKLIKIEKLIFSDNLAFLVQKSETKSEPLKILAEFDKIKNSFILGSDENVKDMLECENIEIKNNILSANCSTYSGFKNTEIIGFSGNEKDNIVGTSASVAISFLNYIDKNSSKFKNIEKQKIFNIENSTEKTGLFKKTNFKIKLQYNPNFNLSL